jgi:hypothetical protein
MRWVSRCSNQPCSRLHKDSLVLSGPCCTSHVPADMPAGGFKLWECAIDLCNYLIQHLKLDPETMLSARPTAAPLQASCTRLQMSLVRRTEEYAKHGTIEYAKGTIEKHLRGWGSAVSVGRNLDRWQARCMQVLGAGILSNSITGERQSSAFHSLGPLPCVCRARRCWSWGVGMGCLVSCACWRGQKCISRWVMSADTREAL